MDRTGQLCDIQMLIAEVDADASNTLSRLDSWQELESCVSISTGGQSNRSDTSVVLPRAYLEEVVLTMRSPMDSHRTWNWLGSRRAGARFRPLARGCVGQIPQVGHRIGRAQRARIPKASPMTSTSSNALFQKSGTATLLSWSRASFVSL